MKQRLLAFLFLILPLVSFFPGTPSQAAPPSPAPGTTWYIRADGGTRYSAARAAKSWTVQCDGQHDAPFPAVGTTNVSGKVSDGINQPCAFNDYRFLYDDQTYGNSAWVIAGGDTVIVRDGPWRIGFDQGVSPNDIWCAGGNGAFSCVNPTIPSGTASQHTRILGANYASCSHVQQSLTSNMTQLFAGYGAYTPMNANGAAFVDLQCLDLTSHASCIVHGSPNPMPCSSSYPISDYDSDGVLTNTGTHDFYMQDLWIHGHTDRGIKGAIGGIVQCLRCDIEYNGMAGWDFDDGSSSPTGYGTPSINGDWRFLYSTIAWSGCNQEYPMVHTYPISYCYSQGSGGYGDGVGSPPGTSFKTTVNGSSFVYNTQDGLDIGHADSGPSGAGFSDHGSSPYSVTNSFFYANQGQGPKWGPNMNPSVVQNNIIIANGFRNGAPLNGAPSTYNKYLADFDRAGSAVSFNFHAGGTGIFSNNTIITYMPTIYTVSCWEGANQCPGAIFTVENNLHYGLENPRETGYNGNSGGIGDFCFVASGNCLNSASVIPSIIESHNLWYGVRNHTCSSTEVCADPGFVNEPAGDLIINDKSSTAFQEAAWDGFNASLSSGSPAKGAGVTRSGGTYDYNNFARLSSPAIGAVEYGSTYTPPVAAPAPAPSPAPAPAPSPAPTPTLTSIAFTTPNPINLVAGSSVTPTCIATFSDASTKTCTAAGATFSSSAASAAAANASTGAITATAAGSGNLLATVGSVVGMDSFTVTLPPPTLRSLTFASPNPINLVAGSSVTPACTATFSDTSTKTCVAAGAIFSSTATFAATANASTGAVTATAAGSGNLLATVGSVVGTDPFTVTAPRTVENVSITIAQPQFGFNVIPGSTRRIFATVTNGTSNQVKWSVKSGSAQISSTSGSWIDVTAAAAGSSCHASGTAVSSATQFTVEAASVDDTSRVADITFNVCNPSVQVSTVPAYRTLYAKQTADIQSLVVGSVNDGVTWAITTQPAKGDGKLVDSTSRDTLFSATVPGRYTLVATSVADQRQTSSSILYVTGHSMPYRVTPNLTEPVDCSVDPEMLGSRYEVGPSQRYHRLQDLSLGTIQAGSTIRLHNEDTTGLNPTTYHEYIQLAQKGTPSQPIRLCGLPDVNGNLPIVDASKSTGRSDTSASVAGAGLITVGGSTSGAVWPAFNGAQNIVIEGLHLRGAKAGVSYTSPAGTASTWQSSAACLRIADGHGISLIGNEMDGCANGAASSWNGATWGGSSLNHLWEGNYVHGSGTSGSSANHQMYLQAWGQVVQFNRIDAITPGSTGANLKSRGIQDVIRYNYFGDGSARHMDLVEVGTPAQFMSFGDFFQNNASPSAPAYSLDQLAAWQEAWNSHFAYGNSYLNSTSMSPIHFAYDQTATEPARKGNLYWYNNTFDETLCSICSGQLWTMFDTGAGSGANLTQTEFQTVQAFNNVVWMNNPAKPVFQWNNFDAFIGVGGSNLLPVGWGADTLQGGAGDGWNAAANFAAYQNAGSLSLHVKGFDGSNVETASSLPFDKVSWILTNAAAASSSIPAAACAMPTRFTYLPALGYAVPRAASLNLGATDTTSQTAAIINLVGGTRQASTGATCR